MLIADVISYSYLTVEKLLRLHKDVSVYTASKRQAQACFWYQTVLPVTHMLSHKEKDLGTITMQSSATVTLCFSCHMLKGWKAESSRLLWESNPDSLACEAVTVTTWPL